jgi:L-cysteate sulfo-lyase
MTTQASRLEGLKARINSFPRVRLGVLPTPLEKLSRLSHDLGVNLYIKRDDQTGLAMGGNKTRKLEFIMADAIAQGADGILTWAGVQSNWCRQFVAAARRVGIQPFLVIFKRPGLPSEVDGNFLLDRIFGADITTFELEKGSSISELPRVQKFVDLVTTRAKGKSKKLYLAPIGGSRSEGSMHDPWGAIGYVSAMLELAEQTKDQHITFDHLVLATSSGSTHAGLLAGARLLDLRMAIIGISMSETKEEIARVVERIEAQTLEFIGGELNKNLGEITVFDDYIGGGYGVLDEHTVRAIRLVAEKEGILLDPVYTGKAMAGLLDLCAKGYFRPEENVVFLHTGGTPALFPYRNGVLEHLRQRKI